MRYLFGDSSESPLESNYLAFLRDAIEFGVVVLLADAGITGVRERRTQRQRAAEQAVLQVEEFGRSALQLSEPLIGGEAPVNRCAAAIAQATTEAVKREAARVRGTLSTEQAQLDAETQKLREKCATALGALLAAHDLPDAAESLTVEWTGAAYEARLRQRAFGVEATVALDVPAGSLFAHDLKVEKVDGTAEVHAPEAAGWMKKQVKIVPHKLGRHHVTHVIIAPSGVIVRLRATPEAGGAGFDVTVARKGEVTVERAGAKADDATFTTDERDFGPMRSLVERLEEAARALRVTRGALIDATLDGQPLATHEHPRAIVERLVDTMEPVVREIAAHSLSPRELVLKRLLGGDRREEIFLSRAELVAKLEPLPRELRRVFAPLGLVDDAVPAPIAAPPPRPAMGTRPPPVEPVAPPSPPVAAAEPPPPPPPVLAVADFATEPPATIAMEAELPPMRDATLPPLAPARGRRTVPPPPPRRTGPVTPGSTDAMVDAALRDLEEAEPTQVAPPTPRPPRLPSD